MKEDRRWLVGVTSVPASTLWNESASGELEPAGLSGRMGAIGSQTTGVP
jgi:hypothetical protein